MSIESISEIVVRLAARKLGVKFEPIRVDSSPTALDVEDGFLEDFAKGNKPSKKSVQYQTFDSEPE